MAGGCTAHSGVEGMISSGHPHLDELHAAVKVCVNGQHQSPVGDGLHQLRHGDLVRWQEHDGGNARVRAVR